MYLHISQTFLKIKKKTSRGKQDGAFKYNVSFVFLFCKSNELSHGCHPQHSSTLYILEQKGTGSFFTV